MTEFDRKTVSKFILSLAEEYEGIDTDELEEKFNKLCKVSKPKKKVSIKDPKDTAEIDTTPLTEQDLADKTVVQLKELCRSRKLKVSGKKDELKARLLGKEPEAGTTTTKKKKDEGYKPPARITTKHVKAEKNAEVIKKIESVQATQPIRRDANGNLVHGATGLIFSDEEDPIKKTRLVIGVSKDGEKSKLTVEDIEKCKQYKFEYLLPDNLATDKDEDIEELDGEEDIEMEEEESEEEENDEEE